MSLNFDHLQRCNLTLELSLDSLKKCEGDSIAYEVCRNATIKSFELALETAGKLLRKVLKSYVASPKEIDALIFKDVLRQAALRGLLSAEELERWLQYRDSRNLTAHDYGEELAEGSLKLIELFQLDLTRLHKVLVEKHG